MTYFIARYPVHLIDVIRLANGSRITIRPTLPQDDDLQQRFFTSLSAEGRYCRFMTRYNEVPGALIEHFTCVDYCSHLALLAEVFEDGRETMVGEARYVVDDHAPGTCEFAIAVADDWQARGIAKALLDRLEHHAATSGIRCMVADTLLSNEAMMGLARRTGYTVKSSRDDPTLARLEKNLAPASTMRPAELSAA